MRGKRAGGPNGEGYVQIKINGATYGAGRLAWLWMTGRWPEKEIDHENRVRGDNRWTNLREATRSTNCINKMFHRQNRHGFRGLKIQTNGRYQAVLTVGQVEYYCGTYGTKEEAAMAYDIAAIQHHGEFAVLNFPNGWSA
jgi:hypothetical protein